MEENAPLFGDTFSPVDLPELSIDSKVSQVNKLPDLGKTIDITQPPMKFNFPLFNQIPKPSEVKQPSLDDRIGNSLSKLGGNYAGEIRQADALKYNDNLLGYSANRNNDDVYSDKGNWYSGTARFLNETVNWTKAGLYSVKGVFDAVGSGDYSKVWDNDFNKEMLAESEGIQYLYPIYKSQAAQDNPWNVFATGNIAENVSNLGMVTGTVISTLAQDLAIAAVGAVLTPETFGGSAVAGVGGIVANTGRNIALAYKNINSLSNLMSKANSAKNAFNAIKAGESLAQVIKNTASINSGFKATAQLLKNTLVASGEAGFEATQVYDGIKNKLLEDNPKADVESVLKTAKAAGNLAYGLNQALLNVTNTVTYGKLLTGKLLTNTLKDLPLEIVADAATGTMNMQAKKGFFNTYAGHYFNELIGSVSIKKGLKIKVGGLLSEAGEEGLQFAIQNGTDAYYKDKFSNKDAGLVNYIGKGLGSMLTDEGLANMAGGAFIGGLSSVGGQMFTDITKKGSSDLSYRQYKKQINEYTDAFNRTKDLFHFAADAVAPIDLEGKGLFDVKNEYEDFVHNFALFGIKQGNLGARLDAIQEFKNATPEEFQKFSGIKVESPEEVGKIVDSITDRIKVTQDSFQEINSAFGVNPFASDDFFTGAIGKLASKTKQTEKAMNGAIWEAAKDQAVKQLVHYKNKSTRDEDLTKEVSTDVLDEHKDLFESFLNSPIVGLNKGYNKSANIHEQTSAFFDFFDQMIKSNDEMLKGLGDLANVIKEKQNIENTKKFYESINEKFQNGDMEGFYRDFYKVLSGKDEQGINFERDLNHFIVNTSDIIKLRFAKKFLSNDLGKLQTREGQKTLIKRNIENFQFYTYLNELKDKKEKGEIISATVEKNGERHEVKTDDEVAKPKEPTPAVPVSTPNTDPISESDWTRFKSSNTVSDAILQSIASKDKSTLSFRELDIYRKNQAKIDKLSKVNQPSNYDSIKAKLIDLINKSQLNVNQVIVQIKSVIDKKLASFYGVETLTLAEQKKLSTEVGEESKKTTATEDAAFEEVFGDNPKPQTTPTNQPTTVSPDIDFRNFFSGLGEATLKLIITEVKNNGFFQATIPANLDIEKEIRKLLKLISDHNIKEKDNLILARNGNVIRIGKDDITKQIDINYLDSQGKIFINNKEVESYTLNKGLKGELFSIDVVFKDNIPNTSGVTTQKYLNSLKQSFQFDGQGRLYQPSDKIQDLKLYKSITKTAQATNTNQKVPAIIFSTPNTKQLTISVEGKEYNVATSMKRAKTLVEINGVIVPFYLTSGEGGKGLVPGWYPFFGIGKDGWMNKTGKNDMESYYESMWGKEVATIIKQVASELNTKYGTDPSNFKDDIDTTSNKPLSSFNDKAENFINSKLSVTPVSNKQSDTLTSLETNVKQLGKKILENNQSNSKIKELESKIKFTPFEQSILDLLPDYSNVNITIENDRGGLGYVGDFKEREDSINNTGRISTTIKYSGIPSAEIFIHELLHYFTIPALINYTTAQKGSNIEIYVKSLSDLYQKAKSLGYTVVNGTSVHENLNEFAVNLTNQKSVEQLKKLGLYDEYLRILKTYLQSITSQSNSNVSESIELQEGKKILESLNYKKENRNPENGNVLGGQSGWKIRFNILNPATNSHYTKDSVDENYTKNSNILIDFLNTYFSTTTTNKAGYRKGKNTSIWKHLSGGEVGESDFTIYIGSESDVLKFIKDLEKSEIYNLLTNGVQSDDFSFNDKIKGRVEGRDIGFAGYRVPEGFSSLFKNGTEFNHDNNKFEFSADLKTVIVNSKDGYSLDQFDNSEFLNKYNLTWGLLRVLIAKSVYGNYIAEKVDYTQTTSNNIQTQIDELNKKREEELQREFYRIEEDAEFWKDDEDRYFVISIKKNGDKQVIASDETGKRWGNIQTYDGSLESSKLIYNGTKIDKDVKLKTDNVSKKINEKYDTEIAKLNNQDTSQTSTQNEAKITTVQGVNLTPTTEVKPEVKTEVQPTPVQKLTLDLKPVDPELEKEFLNVILPSIVYKLNTIIGLRENNELKDSNNNDIEQEEKDKFNTNFDKVFEAVINQTKLGFTKWDEKYDIKDENGKAIPVPKVGRSGKSKYAAILYINSLMKGLRKLNTIVSNNPYEFLESETKSQENLQSQSEYDIYSITDNGIMFEFLQNILPQPTDDMSQEDYDKIYNDKLLEVGKYINNFITFAENLKERITKFNQVENNSVIKIKTLNNEGNEYSVFPHTLFERFFLYVSKLIEAEKPQEVVSEIVAKPPIPQVEEKVELPEQLTKTIVENETITTITAPVKTIQEIEAEALENTIQELKLKYNKLNINIDKC